MEFSNFLYYLQQAHFLVIKPTIIVEKEKTTTSIDDVPVCIYVFKLATYLWKVVKTM